MGFIDFVTFSKGPIANGLHNLTRHSTLTAWLASIGTIQALVKLLELSQNQPSSSMIIMDALNALRIFSRDNDEMKVQGNKNHRLERTWHFPHLLHADILTPLYLHIRLLYFELVVSYSI